MPQPGRIEIFNVNTFRESKTTTTFFRVESKCIIWKTLAINLFLWPTYFKQSKQSSLQPLQYILHLSHDSDNFILYYPFPWSKSLFASRFWGFRWPAATRILSSKRENPGNVVAVNLVGRNQEDAPGQRNPKWRNNSHYIFCFYHLKRYTNDWNGRT